jgi:hypothetical protein
MHLAFIRKKLQEKLFKTAVQIPVDTANVISKHILAIVREFYSLTVGAHEMLSAKESAKVGTKLKRQRFKSAEKGIV